MCAVMTGDSFIKLGFWSQLVLLGLVDWGTLYAFSTQDVAWYHYVGFVLVNVMLLWVTYKMWPWLRQQRSLDQPPHHAPTSGTNAAESQ